MKKPNLNYAVVAELINLSKKHASTPTGPDRWDFLVGQKLMWFDGRSHICKTPPERFSADFRLHAICGAEVNTPKLAVVEDGEYSDPSCPACFAKALEPHRHLNQARGGVLRPTTIACVLAAVVIALNIGLFADDAVQPGVPVATTHQLTYESKEPTEASTFDDL